MRPDWTYDTCRATTGEVDEASFQIASNELQKRYRNVIGLNHSGVGGCAAKEGREFLEEQIAAQVLIDYHEVAGKVVLLSKVDGYDENDASDTIYLDPPAVACIDPSPNPKKSDSLIRWTNDGQLDPYLDMTILEPHPALSGIRPWWIFGTCRPTDGKVEKAEFELAPRKLQERYSEAEVLTVRLIRQVQQGPFWTLFRRQCSRLQSLDLCSLHLFEL